MIVVLTCPRPGTSYVEATVKQIDESARGSTRILLVDSTEDSDGPRHNESFAGWRVETRVRPLRSPQNKWVAWEAFHLAAAENEDLCFFEDDLEFSRNAPRYIENFSVPDDVAFVTFFSPWLERKLPIGLFRVHAHSYTMAQALKFPLRTVRQLVEERGRALGHEGQLLGGFDEILRHIAIQRTWRYAAMHPGIVQHVGANSAVGNGGLVGNRIAHNYLGREFDAEALTLYPKEFFS
jgi:hypothetical protein